MSSEAEKPRRRVGIADRKVFARPESFCTYLQGQLLSCLRTANNRICLLIDICQPSCFPLIFESEHQKGRLWLSVFELDRR